MRFFIMIGIYKITSPTSKVYIGQSINIEKRFKSYRLLHCKQQYHLYNSFLKYGVENHTFEIIEECTVELLNEKERYWQDFYNVISKKGLNLKLTNSSDKRGFFTDEIKQKISKANKGKIRSEEIRKKQSERLKGKTPINKGLKMSIEQRKKLSLIHSGKKRKPFSEETKKKISNAQKGIPRKKHTEETKIKISLKNKNRKLSEKHIENIKKNHTKPNSKKLLDLQDNKIYGSISEYCRCKKISMAKVFQGIYRKSKKYNNLKII
jgi:group I intron endonuclease